MELHKQWGYIRERRDEVEKLGTGVPPEFWDSVVKAMQQQFGEDLRIVILVSSVKDHESDNLKETIYYKQCESQSKKLQRRDSHEPTGVMAPYHDTHAMAYAAPPGHGGACEAPGQTYSTPMND